MLVQLFHSTIISGPETLTLPALNSLELPVTVVFLAERRKAAQSDRCAEYARSFGLSVRQVWVESRYDRRAIQELSALLQELGATLLHSHDVKASAYALAASRISARDGRRTWKLVSTHHGVRGRRGLLNRAYEWYYTHRVLPHFDRILSVCTSDRMLLVSRGLAESRVRVHLNGIDRPRTPGESRPEVQKRIRAEWNLARHGGDPKNVLIGFVGRLEAEKRIDRILRICSHLKNSPEALPPWQLVVFGSGSLDDRLRRQASRLGLGKNVVWMGYRAGLGQELAGFDIVISMSDAEGLPINLIEAGWGATPVFATKVDGNLDLFPSEKLAILVEAAPRFDLPGSSERADRGAAEKLSLLIKDETLRRTMGLEFQKHVAENFSGQLWARRLKSIYRELRTH